MTPQQHYERFERAGWTITKYDHHRIEAHKPGSLTGLRMVVLFGGEPTERQPEAQPVTVNAPRQTSLFR
jgi:hypothetical protein